MKTRIKTAFVALGVITMAGAASAIPTLYLADGGGSYIVFDGSNLGSFDATGSGSAGGGAVSWSGSIGNWSLTVSTGLTLSGGSSPAIDLNLSIDTPSANTPLTVMYSDTGFGPSVGGVSLVSTGSGINGGSVATTAYWGAGNTLFDTTGGTLVNGSVLDSAGNPYSLTLKSIVTPGTTGLNNVKSYDTELSVPDGGTTALLLGAALSALALIRRRLTA